MGSSANISFELCYGKTWSVSIEYPIFLSLLFRCTHLTCCKYEFEEEIAECLHFLKKELSDFKGSCNDDEDLDTEKENSKQRAFAIIGKRSGNPYYATLVVLNSANPPPPPSPPFFSRLQAPRYRISLLRTLRSQKQSKNGLASVSLAQTPPVHLLAALISHATSFLPFPRTPTGGPSSTLPYTYRANSCEPVGALSRLQLSPTWTSCAHECCASG